MPDLDTSVDQLADQILAAFHTLRYRPEQAAWHMRHLLRCHNMHVPEQRFVLKDAVGGVFDLWDRADIAQADGCFAGADQLRWDAQRWIRTYLVSLVPGDAL